MKIYRKTRLEGLKRQKGMTLIELLVAGLISVIVISGMVILMANTLGTGTQTIKMTKLSAEMRAAMQIMTRELRRANYHATYARCFGDIGCLGPPTTDFPKRLNILGKITEININGANDCLWFWYDRPQRCGTSSTCTETPITTETVAAFRRAVIGTTGIIQMTTSGTSAANCPTTGWVNITNPDLVDITAFNADDSVTNFASYTSTVNGTQSIERIGITMSGRLRGDVSLPAFMQGNNAPLLTIQDFVKVRNNVLVP